MLIKRDFFDSLRQSATLESVLLWGARQVGKTTLLDQLPLQSRHFLDDLGERERAQNDPALFLDAVKLPCLIDEVQYAPNIFPEIKLRIDRIRRENVRLASKTSSAPLFYLTGSNRVLLDKNIKESLAGRCQTYMLHGLSVREIMAAFPNSSLRLIIFRGGLPELYTRENVPVIHYLNNYILSFVEKDIAMSSGVVKLAEFHTVIKLLAARSAQFLNVNEIAGAAGVEQKTVQAWIDLLERCGLVQQLAPFHTNLSKRITKMSKFYFYDTGLCARLQSHTSEDTLWNSAQIGALFETLTFSEIMKTRDNFLKDWNVFAWRTKDQDEIDFIVQRENDILFLEAKLAIHGAKPFTLDREALKVFKPPHRKVLVTAGGELVKLDSETTAVPLARLGDFLLTRFS
ncbi:MAG: ATP-binding protein [Oligoflexales bacterium]